MKNRVTLKQVTAQYLYALRKDNLDQLIQLKQFRIINKIIWLEWDKVSSKQIQTFRIGQQQIWQQEMDFVMKILLGQSLKLRKTVKFIESYHSTVQFKIKAQFITVILSYGLFFNSTQSEKFKATLLFDIFVVLCWNKLAKYQNYFMSQQNQKLHQKLFLVGLSTFNIPSISQFPNIMEDSMRFITTQRNIGSVSKDFLGHQNQDQQEQIQQDSLALRIQAIEPTTTSGKKKRIGCTCKKTFCLKMYCECFANDKTCNEDCVCCQCKNVEGNHQKIQQAKENVKQKGTKTCSLSEKRCNCKKSYCQKKYCQCFNSGVSCSDACKCLDCCNKDDISWPRKHQGPPQAKQDIPYSHSFLQKSLQSLENM